MLYLIATPIGNLQDFPLRAIELLKSCDYILCEDTRTSQTLLKHYEIHRPLKSFHQFNETAREDEIISDLKQGLNIAVISDAGTPGINDPGEQLVARCRKENLEVSGVPGPCAAIFALSLSGFSCSRFQYIGFLPKKSGELKGVLQDLISYPDTTIAYESPHRIEATLTSMIPLLKERRICIARELTKRYEEFLFGSAEELLAQLQSKPARGEIVLLISGAVGRDEYAHLSPQEHVALLQEQYGLSQKEAIKLAAQQRGIPKRDIYKEFQND